uniref:Uncharacterized protein n=1 Tax=Octopus bimaculoides TaxID=37653 RepID=A0A0L8FNX2_OCTBM
MLSILRQLSLLVPKASLFFLFCNRFLPLRSLAFLYPFAIHYVHHISILAECSLLPTTPDFLYTQFFS